MKPKRAAFCLEYLKDHNAAAAARRAGYSVKTSDRAGHELLSFPEVRARIAELEKEQVQRVKVEADRLLLELLRIATSDVGEMYDREGKLLPLHEMPEGARRAIGGVETEEKVVGDGEDGEDLATAVRVKKVKLIDKVRALELLGKHKGLWGGGLLEGLDGVKEGRVTVIIGAEVKGAKK